MKIKKIEATWLHVPIPVAQQHVSDFGVSDAFDTTLVRIETEDGAVGYGEGRCSVGSMGNNAALATLINVELAPALIGEDARNPVRIWETIFSGKRSAAALTRGRPFPVLGRRGLLLSAIAGIDMALWDLLGRSLGVPVWQLLGGKTHDALPVYASGGWAPADKIGDQLQGYIDRAGFKSVKMRVGTGDGTVANSVRRVHAAREHLGDDVDIMVDAHGTWSVPEAKRFAREVADCRLAWFEEPVNADNKKGYREVRASTDIPISGGESEFTRFDFRDLIEHDAVDIFQPDPAIAGGITECLRIAHLAEAHQISFAPHLWGGPFHFSAGLQICAVSPAAIIIEYSLGANPLLHELVVENFDVVDGMHRISDQPGLGLTIDEGFVEKHAVK